MPTKIEWATESWNPITGCTPVSEGCEHCYARRMAQRLKGRFGYPEDDPFRVTFHPDKLDQPLHWKKPRMIFVCSMGDLFHKDVPHHTYIENEVPVNHIYITAKRCPQHIFLILTKRPKVMKSFFSWITAFGGKIPDNLWLGVSVENQQRADERIPILLQIPAAKRFVSIEPMLGPVELDHKYRRRWNDKIPAWEMSWMLQDLDWVICGGESGPGARPMHPDWPRSIRDQCQAAGVPFFFKQWGEWAPTFGSCKTGMPLRICRGGQVEPLQFTGNALLYDSFLMFGTEYVIGKFGKKAAGRLLDGREWNEYPEK